MRLRALSAARVAARIASLNLSLRICCPSSPLMGEPARSDSRIVLASVTISYPSTTAGASFQKVFALLLLLQCLKDVARGAQRYLLNRFLPATVVAVE
jgi:hypothetical protein